MIREFGVEAHVFHADVGFKDDMDRLISQVIDRFSRLDYLINNAGGGGTFLGANEDQFDFGLRNNLKSSFLCSQRAARQMIDQGSGGAVVNISSVAANLHHPDHAIYGVAKQALEKLT